MRINRQKRVNKYLNFYINNFGFRKPYQVLLDGTFCFIALQSKVNIHEQLPKYLGGDVKILTTPCAILETESLGKVFYGKRPPVVMLMNKVVMSMWARVYKIQQDIVYKKSFIVLSSADLPQFNFFKFLGPQVYGAMLILKQFPVHQCGHKDPVGASNCIRNMLNRNNPNRYILATQDRDLQKIARRIPGTPLLYIHNRAPTLEQPSFRTSFIAQKKLRNSCELSKTEKKVLKEYKTAVFGPEPPKRRTRKKKKGGPNPLSCKKKKKKPQQENTKQIKCQGSNE